jgi:2-polyprenyl-3-methyl-5-hydroxy-6-metoxy-1,4-benzoquinol methylase
MYIVKRAAALMSAFLKSYGPSSIKKRLWDKEFSGTKWDFINDTAGDCVYSHLETHLNKGSILDLGCGPGNTANELADNVYQAYVGVDVSEAALTKAKKRTEASGRVGKNTFVQGDFLTYDPKQLFDVILFRESMYHVPLGKVKTTLDHYSKFLKDTGVFVVRMGLGGADGEPRRRPMAMLNVMESEFDIVEKDEYGSRVIVIVLRPRQHVSRTTKVPPQ